MKRKKQITSTTDTLERLNALANRLRKARGLPPVPLPKPLNLANHKTDCLCAWCEPYLKVSSHGDVGANPACLPRDPRGPCRWCNECRERVRADPMTPIRYWLQIEAAVSADLIRELHAKAKARAAKPKPKPRKRQ
ncbi:hypothetical protein VT84_12055 [Gemmata sp. SH-PL17]|uniref:hypothetical protein n=1 Tax=Gemmata sp. SH-PL17 TaxID=1630693 RepID=UPI00078CB5A1|nr:hypothetical protein [Gemmata sp. SH-PL17]AMV25122.1 hypothetical protein VT84_12055 [Gemmata sp. SH-PL17]